MKSPGGSAESVSIETGTVFTWEAGVRLHALQDAAFVFPGEILQKGEELGAVFDVSDDDADVTLDPSEDGEGLETITIFLKVNESMTIRRSSEVIHAMLSEDDTGTKEFLKVDE